MSYPRPSLPIRLKQYFSTLNHETPLNSSRQKGKKSILDIEISLFRTISIIGWNMRLPIRKSTPDFSLIFLILYVCISNFLLMSRRNEDDNLTVECIEHFHNKNKSFKTTSLKLLFLL